MSSFTAPVVVKVLDGYKFELIEPFEFYIKEKDGEKIVIPTGYVTDFASVPRFFWNVLPPIGRYTKAAIVHDYMYDNAIKTKKDADLIFREAMKALGVSRLKRNIMYFAVAVFGRGTY